jgi:glutathione peroxidase
MKLTQIPLRKIDGSETKLADYSGQVLLLVNVASQCGLTPQYEGLESLYEKYRAQGFSVLGFPANEFGAQEPGTNDEIQKFCTMNFGVKFPMFQKIVVKGPGQHALYQELTAGKDIQWKFEKFLIGRQGEVLGRFAPTVTPNDPALVQAIESALAAG